MRNGTGIIQSPGIQACVRTTPSVLQAKGIVGVSFSVVSVGAVGVLVLLLL